MIETMFSSVDRERSVSSMRRMNAPRWWRAKSQLNSAVRAPPTCRCPVGLGAKRTRTSVISVLLEEPAPRRGRERADAGAADARVPEPVVIYVGRERRPHDQRRVQEQVLERPQWPAPDELVAPDHEATT